MKFPFLDGSETCLPVLPLLWSHHSSLRGEIEQAHETVADKPIECFFLTNHRFKWFICSFCYKLLIIPCKSESHMVYFFALLKSGIGEWCLFLLNHCVDLKTFKHSVSPQFYLIQCKDQGMQFWENNYFLEVLLIFFLHDYNLLRPGIRQILIWEVTKWTNCSLYQVRWPSLKNSFRERTVYEPHETELSLTCYRKPSPFSYFMFFGLQNLVHLYLR